MFHLLFTVRRNVRIASAGIYYLFAMEVEGAVLCQCQSVAAWLDLPRTGTPILHVSYNIHFSCKFEMFFEKC